MRTILLISLAYLCSYNALAAVVQSGGTACTASTNPWGTTRCPTANCITYYDNTNSVPLAGYTCTTAATGYNAYSVVNNGADTTGNTNDYVCVQNCATSTTATIPCDTTGSFCAACASGYAASGAAPSAASPQPCDCIVAADKSQTCPACAHGYYGSDASNKAVAPNSISGSSDSTYTLQFSGTLPVKCVACPTLSNCAQCASATVCAKCTAASGNTPDSNGSCFASKILASVTFIFAGLVALLF